MTNGINFKYHTIIVQTLGKDGNYTIKRVLIKNIFKLYNFKVSGKNYKEL